MALFSINPTKTKAWEELQLHFNEVHTMDVRKLFQEDVNRFENLSIRTNHLLFDFSKNRITNDTLSKLVALAKETGVEDAIQKYFSGDPINATENRAVLHTALRTPKGEQIKLGNKNIINDVHAARVKIKKFVREIISGARTGFTNKKITDVVNIGIGGSDLGPRFVTNALAFYKNHLNVHFISNIDPDYIQDLLVTLNPETTLFVVVSKTFTTDETISNASFCRTWFLQKGCILDIEKHFVAVSHNKKEAESFGIASENIFPMWDWVGGRYSLWSAVGLSIALAIGYKNFELLLEGAHEMDIHFKTQPLEQNIPIVTALLSIWYNNFYETETEAVIPYSQYLERLPAFLQQLSMESNGKSVDRNGNAVTYQTGNVIWGDCGTNSQHAFFQLIHQGTKLIPIDFIGFINPLHESLAQQYAKLTVNMFAQADALLTGKTKDQLKDADQNGLQAPHKIFEGNKPSSIFLFEKLCPKTIGILLAMYEHKTFVQGVIWNIYSFDQFGVELGKQRFKEIFENNSINTSKSSLYFTNQILNFYLKNKK
ncbi:glucose-6-phosphate isomerase [Flavobacterium agricola]|uniref:Glucose-6-phosphate isomerase n=1 Tax=Flavobacterium agricola TaxID=2870839 RepID=A0ABY6M1N3_9FLAO|nr:glucose-6-phosphate isomerase [Flavobacterium agricola]UYW01138.1 glucose-6-phosphate isomerase [Flavobacterium agricola]